MKAASLFLALLALAPLAAADPPATQACTPNYAFIDPWYRACVANDAPLHDCVTLYESGAALVRVCTPTLSANVDPDEFAYCTPTWASPQTQACVSRDHTWYCYSLWTGMPPGIADCFQFVGP